MVWPTCSEDTEAQWMLAKIKRIDDKKGYYITYLDCQKRI